MFDSINSTSILNLFLDAVVVIVGAVVALVSFAFLIPLDTVPAITGVSLILALSYAIALLAWICVLYFYKNTEQLTMMNTHIIFLVLLPATVAATAMNVTSVQNTRNLLAGQVTG